MMRLLEAPRLPEVRPAQPSGRCPTSHQRALSTTKSWFFHSPGASLGQSSDGDTQAQGGTATCPRPESHGQTSCPQQLCSARHWGPSGCFSHVVVTSTSEDSGLGASVWPPAFARQKQNPHCPPAVVTGS